MVVRMIKKYLGLLKKIPERHYFPIFVIVSLYFIVPMSEVVVTIGAILYFKFETKVRPVVGRLTKRLPTWLTYGGSVLFFLVMIDDTLFYVVLFIMAIWGASKASKPDQNDQE